MHLFHAHLCICSTWSTARSGGDGWPTDHGASSTGGNNGSGSQLINEDPMKNSGGMSDTWQTDLVPEFEPGKPWKGTHIFKTVDDDPTLTPGSVSLSLHHSL